MRKFIKSMFDTILYVLFDKRGELRNDDKPKKETIDEIEIDGVIYRLVAEYRGDTDFNKTVSEWAMKKVIEELKTIA